LTFGGKEGVGNGTLLQVFVYLKKLVGW
jgi:hypothetical protein